MLGEKATLDFLVECGVVGFRQKLFFSLTWSRSAVIFFGGELLPPTKSKKSEENNPVNNDPDRHYYYPSTISNKEMHNSHDDSRVYNFGDEKKQNGGRLVSP